LARLSRHVHAAQRRIIDLANKMSRLSPGDAAKCRLDYFNEKSGGSDQ
jgi:hypothetical protein